MFIHKKKNVPLLLAIFCFGFQIYGLVAVTQAQPVLGTVQQNGSVVSPKKSEDADAAGDPGKIKNSQSVHVPPPAASEVSSPLKGAIQARAVYGFSLTDALTEITGGLNLYEQVVTQGTLVLKGPLLKQEAASCNQLVRYFSSFHKPNFWIIR